MTTNTTQHRDALDRLDVAGMQEQIARLTAEVRSLQDILGTASAENRSMGDALTGLLLEVEALRAVAVAAARLADIVNVGQTYTQDLAMEASLELAEIAHEELSEKIAAARNAGYLAGEEVGA